MRWLLLLAMTSTLANADPRGDFAAKLARVRPGMTAAEVTKLLGAPDDVKTERDRGGIRAARTVEIWRYGVVGHLQVATRGSVHIQADQTVQYVFGGTGKPLAMPEAQLRDLLQRLADVPSYDDDLDPLRLVRAVNALHALGKDRALDVIAEYLRVSSPLDDPGREGVFLVLRTLFDVTGDMPPMMVGAATPAPDPKRFPRHPIVILGDVPLKIVRGYALAGEPQTPESDVAAFRQVGRLRAQPLAPRGTALDDLAAFLATPAGKLVEPGYLVEQALRAFATVYRPAAGDLTVHRAALARMRPAWNPRTQQLEDHGKVLPPVPAITSPRVWWDLAKTARLTFERVDDAVVDVELRIGGGTVTDRVRLVDPKTGRELAKLDVRVGNIVTAQRIALPKGHSLRAELASGPRSPVLTP